MLAAGEVLLGVLRQAWALLAGLVLLTALLGGLAQLFKFTGSVALGARSWVSDALVGMLGVIVIALVGFLAIPGLAQAASIGARTGCGPITELGQLAAMLIAAIGSLRMLQSVLAAVVSYSMGGSRGVASALIEIAETIFGMLLITVAAPVAAAFFGACG